MRTWCQALLDASDRFLFDSCDPRIVPVMRVGYAMLLLIHTAVAWADAGRWFSDDGVLRAETAQRILGPSGWSLLYLFPSTETVAQIGLTALFVHALLLLLGLWSRLQAAAIFVWLVSFQNRNPFINDGEDIVFRLIAFMMIWLPLDAYWSLGRRRTKAMETSDLWIPDKSSAWGLRLIQMEMTAIYASTAFCKLEGDTWHNGTALWYVSRMTDDFGRCIPSSWFDHPGLTAAATWSVLIVEFAMPVAFWFRATRKLAILAGVGLHLGIELSMNLFLFQWIMMLGLLAFVVPSEWKTPFPSTKSKG